MHAYMYVYLCFIYPYTYIYIIGAFYYVSYCDCFFFFSPTLSLSQEYFFDPEVLTEGEVAPNDRCCRICGKIGHFMKDCPMRRKYVDLQPLRVWTILLMKNVRIAGGLLLTVTHFFAQAQAQERPREMAGEPERLSGEVWWK